MTKLIKNINDFLFLQKGLVALLLEQNSVCKDFKFVIDFPKNGEVVFNGDHWKFIKHGAGFLFINESNGIEIDVRREITEDDSFDFNRIEQYLESLNVKTCELEELFESNLKEGKIIIVDNIYRMMKLKKLELI